MKRYGFLVDSRSCSGCKACQLACKDKNALPPGVLWRRVIAVEAGGWHQRGDVWEQDLKNYHISSSCMHCRLPICVEVCPTGAMTRTEQNIVEVNRERCMGCRYCEMACPYHAPCFDPEVGQMGKCNFCRELITQGLEPSCVVACPMRALRFGEFSQLHHENAGTAVIYPLPESDLTEPSLVLLPHQESVTVAGEAQVTNWEEL